MKRKTALKKRMKVLESYEKKGYIVDDAFESEYAKEIEKKIKQIK